MWTVTLNQSAAELLFLALFIFFSLLLFSEEKKGFSSFACARLYACVCVCENKQKGERWRVLSTTRHTEKENVCRFEIGRDKKKKSTTVSVSHAKNRREKREREREEVSSIHCDVVLEIFFFSFSFFSSIKIFYIKKMGLVDERKIIINASTHTCSRALVLLLESWWNELALGRKGWRRERHWRCHRQKQSVSHPIKIQTKIDW